MNDKLDLFIVGNGAACVALLGALSVRHRQTGARFRIGVAGSITSLGYGQNFAEDNAALLMNSPASDLSILEENRGHFVAWLRENGHDYPENAFVPRSIFGRYLNATALDLLAAGAHAVTMIDEQVMDIEPEADGYVVATSRQRYHCQAAVLATGGAPHDPYRLTGSPNFFQKTFPIDPTIDQIRLDGSVFILGSSLSSIDVSLALSRRGFRGRMTFLSRRGRLPSIKCKREDAVLHYVRRDVILRSALSGKVKLRTVLRLARRDFQAYDFDWRTLFVTRSAGDCESLETEIARANQPIPWLNLVNQMQSELDGVWPHLDPLDRNTLISNFMPGLMHELAGIPLENAQRLHALFVSGQQKNADGLRELHPADGRFIARFNDGSVAVADYVINATGSTRRPMSPLLRSLLGRGLAREHPTGGIDCCAHTGQLLDATGAFLAGLYALGHPTCGVHPIINHIGAIVARADVLGALLCRLGNGIRRPTRPTDASLP